MDIFYLLVDLLMYRSINENVLRKLKSVMAVEDAEALKEMSHGLVNLFHLTTTVEPVSI